MKHLKKLGVFLRKTIALILLLISILMFIPPVILWILYTIIDSPKTGWETIKGIYIALKEILK